MVGRSQLHKFGSIEVRRTATQASAGSSTSQDFGLLGPPASPERLPCPTLNAYVLYVYDRMLCACDWTSAWFCTFMMTWLHLMVMWETTVGSTLSLPKLDQCTTSSVECKVVSACRPPVWWTRPRVSLIKCYRLPVWWTRLRVSLTNCYLIMSGKCTYRVKKLPVSELRFCLFIMEWVVVRVDHSRVQDLLLESHICHSVSRIQ